MKAKLADGSRPAEGNLCGKLHRRLLEVMSEVLELALAQFADESLLPSIQISAQDIKFGFDRLAQ
jgi:hypothetical protein